MAARIWLAGLEEGPGRGGVVPLSPSSLHERRSSIYHPQRNFDQRLLSQPGQQFLSGSLKRQYEINYGTKHQDLTWDESSIIVLFDALGRLVLIPGMAPVVST